MSVKVSELTASTGITSDDLLLTVNDPGGTPQSRKATAQQMLDYVTGSTFNTLTVTSLSSSNVNLSGNFSGTFVGDGSGLTGLSIPTNNFTLGSTNIVLGTTASLVEGLTTLTSSNVTGSTAKFTTISGTNANISGDLTVAGILTATEYHTTVVSASIIYQSGSTKFGNDSGDTHQFSGSILISGTLNANNTISGTTAQFTTVTASTLSVSGGNLIIYETASIGDYAYILYNGTYDKLVAFPGLYVSGNLTGSGHAKFNEVSGTTAQFTVVSASSISASSYIGLPTSSGGTPGGTNTTVQFNSGSTFSGSSNLVWDYTNNRLGVGTTSPQVTTEIVKGTQLTKVSNDTVLFVSNNTSPTTYIEIANTTTGASGIAFTRGNGTGNAGAIDYSNASNKMTFYTADSARAVIDTNGNVGIGTTSPSFKADIRGNTTADLYVGTSDTTAVYLSASNTGTGGYTLIVAADGSGAKIRTNSSARDLQLGTNSTTALTIDTSQRVGIGTTNPGTKLQVIGDAAVGNPDTTSIYLTASNGGGYSLVLSADSTGAKVETNVSSRDLRLGTNSITALTIDTSQRVGIGTTSPNAKLDVNGNTIISGNLTVTGSIFVSGSSIYGQVAELTSSTTNYTLVRQDSGKFLNINSGSAVTVTVPTGLPTGFTVSLCQLGAGQVTVSGEVGVTINNRQSHTKTAGQYAVVSLVGTSADTYVFVGDTTA